MKTIEEILSNKSLTFDDIVSLLKLPIDDANKLLFPKAAAIKEKEVGNVVYYRGLIEYSNICQKDCYYCGIRKSNRKTEHYTLEASEVIHAAKMAIKYNYGSIVIQAGEISGDKFICDIEYAIREIKALDSDLGITLSLGEQTEETYRRWFNAGAHRYLLRIETSNPKLYQKIHPNDSTHLFSNRLESLHLLRKVGYQVGSGIMVGLPFQTLEDVARDILFLKEIDIDMCGLGPYLEHADTPLYAERDNLMSKTDRYNLALKTIAILRIMMKDINIASATSLQAIDKAGREKALKVGTNIIMPNLTPKMYREGYQLYEDKPCVDEDPSQCKSCLEMRIKLFDHDIGYGKWGDSPHFAKRTIAFP
ncbi:MAG: [FeFe] hydrogenase H-cluster radical SAM maturase HydE [Bacteriovoracaceae bacterium]|nr:[FeFe] hydrogenase H-cluster radical SAM maturase HydE [Bacteriovoracaceae bacterium]